MNKIKRIIKLVLDDIAEIYLYFLAFYLICFVLSFFFESWKLFFSWKAFHISAIILGILSLLSDKGRKFILSQKKPLFELIKFPKNIFTIIKSIAKNLVSPLAAKLKRPKKRDYLKFVLIFLILIYSLTKGIEVINFFILAYALISVLFIVESRIAAGIALLFLISCPLLLILKKEAMAETMAIYAYYFLVITVLTQIGEYLREEKEKKLSTGGGIDKGS